MTALPPALSNALAADPILLKAITDAVQACMTMCNAQVRCVGVSTVPMRDPGSVTGMIGVHGSVSGFVTVNLAETAAIAAVGGLLQEPCDHLTPQVIDGVGEIANMVTGGIKKHLAGSPWAFSHVTVPSVIVGHNYQIAYSRGLQYLAVTFEQANDEALMLDDRLIQVAISLLRL
jgi:chemotaxis protein CheX